MSVKRGRLVTNWTPFRTNSDVCGFLVGHHTWQKLGNVLRPPLRRSRGGRTIQRVTHSEQSGAVCVGSANDVASKKEDIKKELEKKT